MCIWARVNFPSPAAGMKSFLWVGFLRLVWENGNCFPLPFPLFPKTQCMDSINPGILHWVGSSFGIAWLPIRLFFFSHLFSCLFLNQGWLTHWIWPAWQFFWLLWTLPWPQKTQFALFIIFCACSCRSGSFVSRGQVCLTGFIKCNRAQHKCGWVVWPLYKISHRWSTSLLSQF